MKRSAYALGRAMGDNITLLLSLIIPHRLLETGMSITGTPLVSAGVRWLKGGR
jgi:hypothetical protein